MTLYTPGEIPGVTQTGREIVNIFQQALLITSDQDDVQMILAVIFLIVAVILFRLAVEAGVHPSAREMAKTFLSADYWIRRQKRKSFGYRT